MSSPLYVKCGAAESAARTPSLTFPAILSDPLVRLVMKADGVDPGALERCLGRIAASLPPPPEAPAAAGLRC